MPNDATSSSAPEDRPVRRALLRRAHPRKPTSAMKVAELERELGLEPPDDPTDLFARCARIEAALAEQKEIDAQRTPAELLREAAELARAPRESEPLDRGYAISLAREAARRVNQGRVDTARRHRPCPLSVPVLRGVGSRTRESHGNSHSSSRPKSSAGSRGSEEPGAGDPPPAPSPLAFTGRDERALTLYGLLSEQPAPWHELAERQELADWPAADRFVAKSDLARDGLARVYCDGRCEKVAQADIAGRIAAVVSRLAPSPDERELLDTAMPLLLAAALSHSSDIIGDLRRLATGLDSHVQLRLFHALPDHLYRRSGEQRAGRWDEQALGEAGS